MAETMVHGASAIEAVIAEHFLEHDVLITLWYGDTVVAQFLSTIDDTEIQHDSEEIDALTDEEADEMPNEAWDRWAKSLTIFCEFIEMVEIDNGSASIKVTFIIDDPAAFVADYDHAKGSLTLWAGGEWMLHLQRSKEPLRHRTHILVYEARRRLMGGGGGSELA